MSKAQEAQQPSTYIPKPNKRYVNIMATVRKCNFNSPANVLCQKIGFQIEDNEMVKLNGRVLIQPKIFTGQNSTANVRIGRIPLDGHLFTPKPLSALAIAYFGPNSQRDSQTMDEFVRALLNVSLFSHLCASNTRLSLSFLGTENVSRRCQTRKTRC